MIAKVVFFSPLRKIFDYLVPSSLVAQATAGTRVVVPLGNKITIGFVVELTANSTLPHDKLKDILEILDRYPLVEPNLYKTLLWAAEYYKSSFGAILDCALPKHIKENKNIKKNINRSSQPNTRPNKGIATVTDSGNKVNLNDAQKIVLKQLLNNLDKFKVNLLEGVTGSGKTEIYLRLTEHVVKQNKQALILVPEIGLTPQTKQRFTTRFPDTNIVVLHSHVNERQRYLNWLDAKNGLAKIIIGTRSAAFVPLLSPGLFIVDEEHDLSFKQQETLRYMARDLLIMRAKITNCPILLGSATPSLETLYNAKLNRYSHYKLPNRAISKLPEMQIIDIRHKKLSSGLSNLTIHTIKEYLNNNHQVLLFINRRGFAPALKCLFCKFIKKCSACDSNMVWHMHSNKLHCHHCHRNQPMPDLCPNCNQAKLALVGQGTERVEQLFKKLFPSANIARIDQDSMSQKNHFDDTINDILQQKINLLIGTQMIAKGHHFPNLQLVAIIDLDNSLFSSDFRATERLTQLIMQVAGRSGRENPGKVLLQSCYPNHPLIQAIANYDYNNFYQILFNERKLSNLPPYSHQILWRTSSTSLQKCMDFLGNIKQFANNLINLDNKLDNKTDKKFYKTFGPIPAIMEKRNKKFHARLLFQHNKRDLLHNINQQIIDFLCNSNIPSSIKWSIDVDPKEIF